MSSPPLSEPPKPTNEPADSGGKTQPPRADWLTHLLRATDTMSPLVTRKTPDPGQAPQDRRGRLAALLGILGITIALIQVLLQALDLTTRAIAPIARVLPYLVAVLLIAGVALAAYSGVRAQTQGQRRRAGLAGALLLAVALAWMGWRLFDYLRQPTGFLIAVGEFDGKSASQRVDFARRIADYLRGELTNMEPPILVERTLESYEDANAAQKAGKGRDAGMVIWGWYDDLGVSSHIEVLNLSMDSRPTIQLGAVFPAANVISGVDLWPAQQPILSSLTQLVNTPAALPDIKLFAADGPEQLAFLTAAVIGLGYVATGELDKAKAMFDRALQTAEQTEMTNGEEIIHHQRAMLAYQDGDATSARADLERALAINPDFYEARNLLAIVLSEGCTPAREPRAALAEAQKAAQLRPDDPLAYRLLSTIYLQLRQPDNAIHAAQRSQGLASNDPESYATLAAAYSAAGDGTAAQAARQDALRLLGAAANDENVSADALFALADAYVSVSDYANAEATYRRADALSPNDARTARGLGNVAYWQGRTEEAVDAYERWQQLDPQNATAAVLIGLIYAGQGDNAGALAQFTEAAQKAKCDSTPFMLLGQQQLLADEVAAAQESFLTGLTIEPENVFFHLALASAAYVRNDYATARPWVESTLKLDPKSADAHLIFGDILAKEGDQEGARSHWKAAVELTENAAPGLTRAYALDRLGRLSEAGTEYERILTIQESSDVRGFLANVYERMGDLDRAITEYEQALVEDPKNSVVALGLANLALSVGTLETAADAYERYLAVEPSALAHSMAARAYTGLLEYERAVEHLRAAAALEPNNVEPVVELGQDLVRLGRLTEAEEVFAQAQAIDPNAPELYVGRASLAYQQCKQIEAITDMERAATLAPENSLYQGMLASHLLGAGNQEEARQIIETLAARPLDDILAHLLAGGGLLTLGQREAARLELTRVAAAAGAPALFISLGAGTLGDLYMIDDKLSAAADAYGQALTAFPAHAGAQLALGDIALMNGNREAALAAYAQVTPLMGDYAMNFGADAARTVQVGLHMRMALLGRQSQAADGGQIELATAQKMVDAWLADAPESPTARFLSAALKSINGDAEAVNIEYEQAIRCDRTLETARQLLERFLERSLGRVTQ